MAVGVVTPKVPSQDDIILGEGKIKVNFECPDEIELGATRGGSTFVVNRTIREINYDGAYGATKGLRRKENITPVLTVNALCLKYFNKKEISYINSNDSVAWESNDWAGNGGTYTAETTLFNHDDMSAKCTADTDGYGIHKVFASSKDLTELSNGESSDTGDYIGFAIYITTAELSNLGTADIRIVLACDSEGTLTNYYYYDVDYSELSNGWNTFKILKSSFSEGGTGDWSAITGVGVQLSGSPSAEVDFYVDNFSLIQDNSESLPILLNTGGFSMTDEGDYKKVIENVEITNEDYLQNIAFDGYTHSGRQVVILLKNVLGDGSISNTMAEKDEVVNSTQFTGHYLQDSPLEVPYEIRYYD